MWQVPFIWKERDHPTYMCFGKFRTRPPFFPLPTTNLSLLLSSPLHSWMELSFPVFPPAAPFIIPVWDWPMYYPWDGNTTWKGWFFKIGGCISVDCTVTYWWILVLFSSPKGKKLKRRRTGFLSSFQGGTGGGGGAKPTSSSSEVFWKARGKRRRKEKIWQGEGKREEEEYSALGKEENWERRRSAKNWETSFEEKMCTFLIHRFQSMHEAPFL